MVYASMNSTAVPAWSPYAEKSYIATGTVAGAMDATFSNNSTLEILELLGNDPQKSNIISLGKSSASGRFHRLAWSSKLDNHDLGLLVGGLENGEINVWDPSKIIDPAQSSNVEPIYKSSIHTGGVCGLQFNPFQNSLMASGAGNGEVLIWDVVNDFKSYSPGSRSTRIESVTDLSWNNQVQHILATSSNTGATVVWDLRNRREVITLSYAGGVAMGMDVSHSMGLGGGRAGVSSVKWHPNSPTQLVTALNDDNSPAILLWDLRNAGTPSQIFQGHTKGILSLSWCLKDSDLLLSSGRDNRTICWNASSGEIISELPVTSNWIFDVQWNQSNPNLISTASFEGKVNVYQIQSSHKETNETEYVEDPFDINANLSSKQSLVLKNPPKWLARPCGATFGFGNKLYSFNSTSTNVKVYQVVSDQKLAERAKELEAKLQGGDVEKLCLERMEAATDKLEIDEWKTLAMLFQPNARDKLIEMLKFDKKTLHERIGKLISKKQNEANVEEVQTKKSKKKGGKDKKKVVDEPVLEKEQTNQPENEDESKPATEEHVPFAADGGDSSDFFNQAIGTNSEPSKDADVDNIANTISDLGIDSKKQEIIEFIGSFSIAKKEPEEDYLIAQSLMLGSIEDAVDLCIECDRFADALILASCSGSELVEKTQKAYFAKHANSASYTRLLYSVYSNDLSDAVRNSDVSEWPEVLALLCTYAQDTQFSHYCGQLGLRLESAFAKADDQNLMWGALLCYLISGNLGKISLIWIKRHQKEDPQTKKLSSPSKLKTKNSLHSFIEKISVLRAAIDYEDPNIGQENASLGPQQFLLGALYDNYVDYAEFLISQGLLMMGAEFLNRVPDSYQSKDIVGNDRVANLKYLLYMAGVSWENTPAPQPSYTLEPIGADLAPKKVSTNVAPTKTEPVYQRKQSIPEYPHQAPLNPYTQQYASQTTYKDPYKNYNPNPVLPTLQSPHIPPNQQYSGYPNQQQISPPNLQPGYSNQPSYNSAMYPQPPPGVGPTTSNLPPSANPLIPPPRPVNPLSVPTGATPPPTKEKAAWNDPPILSKLQKRSNLSNIPKPPVISNPFPQGRNTPPPSTLGNVSGFADSNVAKIPPPPTQSKLPYGAPHNQPAMASQFAQTPVYGYQQHQPISGQPNSFAPQGYMPTQQEPLHSPPQNIPARGQVVPPPQPVHRAMGAATGPISPGSPKQASFGGKASAVQQGYPPGDRTHIPNHWKPIYTKLSASLEKCNKFAVASQKRVVDDCSKRLSALFDLMNNENVSKYSGPDSNILKLFTQLNNSIDTRNYHLASSDVTEIMALESSLTSSMLGIKRMIDILKSLPV
ncbi:hypothetical protein BB559_005398 [Furculomyces boomerangus]|uniref:Protein transport protein SEC31 n=1 Tax=Furculomyces boomerangus TaxID=61424 RepID=A0A2T9Y8Y1_9FUNG|nr:hypothetical protein BB559_005398 [Furculomyces boomerangus]